MNPIVPYVALSAFICATVSLFELLDRYPHSSRFSDVILNGPAIVYLLINLAVGSVAIPVGMATGLLQMTDAGVGASVIKAVGAGFGALGLLRSSFATLKGDLQVGPAAFLDGIKVYLDRKIALQHKLAIEDQITPLLRDVDQQLFRSDLPAICVAGVQRFSKLEIDDLNGVIAAAFEKSISGDVRKIIIGHAICELCGIEVLKSAIARIAVVKNIDENGTAEADTYLKELNDAKDKFLNQDKGTAS